MIPTPCFTAGEFGFFCAVNGYLDLLEYANSHFNIPVLARMHTHSFEYPKNWLECALIALRHGNTNFFQRFHDSKRLEVGKNDWVDYWSLSEDKLGIVESVGYTGNKEIITWFLTNFAPPDLKKVPLLRLERGILMSGNLASVRGYFESKTFLDQFPRYVVTGRSLLIHSALNYATKRLQGAPQRQNLALVRYLVEQVEAPIGHLALMNCVELDRLDIPLGPLQR